MPVLCRDCYYWLDETPAKEHRPKRCSRCNSPRLIIHSELAELTLAHLDCDAFFASVEKRDNPELRDKPLIIGGGKRGVVSTACYLARLYGVRSAMPMYKALKACPKAIVIRPDLSKYRETGLKVRAMMQDLTPLVEPLSIDEAFLDLSGTEKLHGQYAAITLVKLAKNIETQIGISASIGLSYNKSMAKIASDLDKPRGFSVLGRSNTREFLHEQPVRMIWGVGKSLEQQLLRDGLRQIKDLLPLTEEELVLKYGLIGKRLFHFARGEDGRSVTASSPTKSISNETTFNDDLGDFQTLADILWSLCENVSASMKKKNYAASTINLKLKTSDFRQISRSRKCFSPTQLAEELYQTTLPLLKELCNGQKFRLLGVGGSDLVSAEFADPPDLLDPEKEKRKKIEKALDAVRNKLGQESIIKGRSFKKPSPKPESDR
ncbi:DNA polymerase IV [Kiloniella laminariae]|uniref:DNA polymerase IV n=1 Tax=Kiloniella laminariae TaxID=454162 RepID=A0ABT4LGX0_9PROT|nr:DNA polymerase IV [Kiloniella laminariae]MCZ4280355.1 DNA polymerase IV [Kiloniella laminariae]